MWCIEDLQNILKNIDVESDDSSVDDEVLNQKLNNISLLEESDGDQPTNTKSMSAMLREKEVAKQETDNSVKEDLGEAVAEPVDSEVGVTEEVSQLKQEMPSKEPINDLANEKEELVEKTTDESVKGEVIEEVKKLVEELAARVEDASNKVDNEQTQQVESVNEGIKSVSEQPILEDEHVESMNTSESERNEQPEQPIPSSPTIVDIPSSGDNKPTHDTVSHTPSLQDLFPTPLSIDRSSVDIPDEFNTRQFLLIQQINENHPGRFFFKLLSRSSPHSKDFVLWSCSLDSFSVPQ